MQPRIKPLSLEEADPQTRELLGRLIRIKGPNSRIPNIFGTVANNPELLRQWLGFTTYLLTASTLEPRLRFGNFDDEAVGWADREVSVGKAV